MAIGRFHQLERRLLRNPDLREHYTKGIEEYFQLNQIRPAETSEAHHCSNTITNKPTVTSCVLPHHAVIKEDSLTTKLRILFDASAKTSNGRSLNDILCIGAPLQNELPAVILNWRVHKYVFTSDIQKMYRCIDMHPDDAKYQRILWKNDHGELGEFCLTTVTFGTASAPYTAIRIMHQLADDEKHRYPLAEKVLKNEMYVDDILSGSHSIESAIEKLNQVRAALASGGFELRKWSGNYPELLQNIPLDHHANQASRTLDGHATIKTLGIHWSPTEDQFSYKLNFDIDDTATKRKLLSTTARLYDPLGYIAPVVVRAKIMMKEVWVIKIQRSDKSLSALNWDELLPPPLRLKWQQFLKDLPAIDQIKIPRWIDYTPHTVKSIQFHTFCDGSTNAYAANVYIRHIQFVVLYWIYGETNRWKIYVANRVNKILEIASPDQWNYGCTEENPADCATRGLNPTQLSNFGLWWEGPLWLKDPPSSWSKFSASNLEVSETDAELKTTMVQSYATHSIEPFINYY